MTWILMHEQSKYMNFNISQDKLQRGLKCVKMPPSILCIIKIVSLSNRHENNEVVDVLIRRYGKGMKTEMQSVF